MSIWMRQSVRTVYGTTGIVVGTSWETDIENEDMIAPCLIVEMASGRIETYYVRDCRLTSLDGEDDD